MSLPANHLERLHRARLSLEGLAIGDSFGEMLAYNCANARRRVEQGLMGGPWFHTDDTEMALSIFQALHHSGQILPEELAKYFAERFRADPDRGYGTMARYILRQLQLGEPWRAVSESVFDGSGSMGNGSAMRVAPLGAYFADESDSMIRAEAVLSSVVTHSHPEGKAGAIAIAIAAATAWRTRAMSGGEAAQAILHAAYEQTPESETRQGIDRAMKLPLTISPESAGRILGNGSNVTAPDTVPYVLWCVARHVDNFKEALVSTVVGDGDCDTNCAIVGGIVILRTGAECVPGDWRAARERFDFGEQLPDQA